MDKSFEHISLFVLNKIVPLFESNLPLKGFTEVYILIDPAADFNLGSSSVSASDFHTALEIGDTIISYNQNGIHIVLSQYR